ncbi:hypothetical protein [Streptomyces sirii]|uniref:hypothetical protein n=1 Tax=Streptomyces sirii TaxID=3127701 RepID=UPI003D35CD61
MGFHMHLFRYHQLVREADEYRRAQEACNSRPVASSAASGKPRLLRLRLLARWRSVGGRSAWPFP